MTLTAIGLMILAALGAWLFRRDRLTALLAFSVLALYALQAETTGLAVALPTVTVLLVVGAWWLVSPSRAPADMRMLLLLGAACIAGAVLLLLLPPLAEWLRLRMVAAHNPLPLPPLSSVGEQALRQLPGALLPLGIVGVGALSVGALVPESDEAARRRLALGFVVLILILFVILKTPALQAAVAGALPRAGSIRPDWSWLGFSYIAFRLLHVLLDYRIGRLAPVGLRDFALYVVFFPAIPAGPIARIEQFTRELDGPARPDPARLVDGGARIGIGLFKKFVLADLLAYVALSPALVEQSSGGLPLWLMLYAFAFRIFFDFSGYVDIAIGIGLLAGIRLPENFTAPYARRNLTAFWNSWHITLAAWFRAYFFNPISRALMGTALRSRRLLVILIAQVSTMVLIGLWHGVALHFVLWGAWHGLGLWLHKWLLDRTRGWDAYVAERPVLARLIHALSLVFTFHFVAVGWVFFALDDVRLIGRALLGLVGLNG